MRDKPGTQGLNAWDACQVTDWGQETVEQKHRESVTAIDRACAFLDRASAADPSRVIIMDLMDEIDRLQKVAAATVNVADTLNGSKREAV